MKNQFKLIEEFSESVKEMVDAIATIENAGMTIRDVKTILSIVDREDNNNIVSQMDAIASKFIGKPSFTVTDTEDIVQPQQQSVPNNNKPAINWYDLTNDEVITMCKVLIICDFDLDKSAEFCKIHNIRHTVGGLRDLKRKKRWMNISDEYFRKVAWGTYEPVVEVTEQEILDSTATSNALDNIGVLDLENILTQPSDIEPIEVIESIEENGDDEEEFKAAPGMDDTEHYETTFTYTDEMSDYVKSILEQENGSIKRTFNACEAKYGCDITIFDVFNIKYGNKRGLPVRMRDINEVVAKISPAYDYDIEAISRVMRDKCDIVLDASSFHTIRKMARKEGRIADNGSSVQSRKKNLSEEDAEIAHVLCRLDMNLLQAFLHFRSTPYPKTIFQIYEVKRLIGTVTDIDIRIIAINLRRSAGLKYCDIAKDIYNGCGVMLSDSIVKSYITDYEKRRLERAV